MNRLEQLRSDICDAAMEATEKKEDEVDACLDILDEFSAGHEVVDACEHQNGGWRKNNWLRVNCKCDPHRLDYCVSVGPVIIPRKPEPRITDQPIEKRLTVLEDEVKHRCGYLGRRINALEFKRERPLLAAAERAHELLGRILSAHDDDQLHEAFGTLAEAIKKEEER